MVTVGLYGPAFGHMIVNANNGSTVDVADLNALGGTDTD
jgi:hypothetical protein